MGYIAIRNKMAHRSRLIKGDNLQKLLSECLRLSINSYNKEDRIEIYRDDCSNLDKPCYIINNEGDLFKLSDNSDNIKKLLLRMVKTYQYNIPGSTKIAFYKSRKGLDVRVLNSYTTKLGKDNYNEYGDMCIAEKLYGYIEEECNKDCFVLDFSSNTITKKNGGIYYKCMEDGSPIGYAVMLFVVSSFGSRSGFITRDEGTWRLDMYARDGSNSFYFKSKEDAINSINDFLLYLSSNTFDCYDRYVKLIDVNGSTNLVDMYYVTEKGVKHCKCLNDKTLVSKAFKRVMAGIDKSYDNMEIVIRCMHNYELCRVKDMVYPMEKIISPARVDGLQEVIKLDLGVDVRKIAFKKRSMNKLYTEYIY